MTLISSGLFPVHLEELWIWKRPAIFTRSLWMTNCYMTLLPTTVLSESLSTAWSSRLLRFSSLLLRALPGLHYTKLQNSRSMILQSVHLIPFVHLTLTCWPLIIDKRYDFASKDPDRCQARHVKVYAAYNIHVTYDDICTASQPCQTREHWNQRHRKTLRPKHLH